MYAMASVDYIAPIEIDDEETILTIKKLNKSSYPANYIEKFCYSYTISNVEF